MEYWYKKLNDDLPAQFVIAVEGDEPQVFIEKRDNWAKELLRTRDYYENGYYLA